MARRGPKPSPLAAPRVPLSCVAPRSLPAALRKRYVALASELTAEGYACQCDWRTVALVVKIEAHAERLEEEVGKLDEFVLHTDKGAKVNPLLTELRGTRAQLASLYGLLFLQPKARATSRVSPERMRGAGTDELGEFLQS